MAAELMKVLEVKSYGILGRSSSGPKVEAPDKETILVDPAGLHHIREGPWGAAGAAGANYAWLEIDEDESFPEDVVKAITEPLIAKFHAYADGQKNCIHVVGPDFRMRDFTRAEAVAELATAYGNVFNEFCEEGKKKGLKKMRLLPISGGIFSGPFREVLPELTAEAVQAAYVKLSEEQKKHMMDSSIEMCIFMDAEFDLFRAAFGDLSGPAKEPAPAAKEPEATVETTATDPP